VGILTSFKGKGGRKSGLAFDHQTERKKEKEKKKIPRRIYMVEKLERTLVLHYGR
jgi:hypothetical protein